MSLVRSTVPPRRPGPAGVPNRNPHATSKSNMKGVTETPFETNGQEHIARLLHLSRRGGRLATKHKPSVGSLIRICRITAQVVDHFQDGVAIKFVDIHELN